MIRPLLCPSHLLEGDIQSTADTRRDVFKTKTGISRKHSSCSVDLSYRKAGLDKPHLGIEPRIFRLQGGCSNHYASAAKEREDNEHLPLMYRLSIIAIRPASSTH